MQKGKMKIYVNSYLQNPSVSTRELAKRVNYPKITVARVIKTIQGNSRRGWMSFWKLRLIPTSWIMILPKNTATNSGLHADWSTIGPGSDETRWTLKLMRNSTNQITGVEFYTASARAARFLANSSLFSRICSWQKRLSIRKCTSKTDGFNPSLSLLTVQCRFRRIKSDTIRAKTW